MILRSDSVAAPLTACLPAYCDCACRYFFHTTSDSNYVCQQVCGSTCTFAGGRSEGRTEVCFIWYGGDLRNMGCGNGYVDHSDGGFAMKGAWPACSSNAMSSSLFR